MDLDFFTRQSIQRRANAETAGGFILIGEQDDDMQTREFPVLGNEDRNIIDTLAVGLDRDTARVLAYLILRADSTSDIEPAATRLAIRIGTDLGRSAASKALKSLKEAGLVTETTVNRPSRGRPPKVWQTATNRDEITTQVRHNHADALLNQAVDVATAFGTQLSLTPDADDSAPIKVHVGLNWVPNGFHVPLFVAARDGLYRDVNIDVPFTVASGSAMALKWITEHRTDISIIGSATLCHALQSKTPVVPIALLYQRAMTVLYTVREEFGKPFTNIEQLRDRTIAMPTGSETGLLAHLFLSQADLLDDVTIVDVPGEEQTALLNGTADVVTGMAADPLVLEEEGYTVDSVLVSEQFPVPGQVLVTHANTLTNRSGDIKRFLVGTMGGWVTAKQNPQNAARAVAKRSNASVDIERQRFEVAIERFADQAVTQKHGWGWQAIEDWQRLIIAMHQTDSFKGIT